MRVLSAVAMLGVESVPRALAFYEQLGFVVGNTHTPKGATEPVWAYLESGAARLMLARADSPVVPEQQRVLFYLYTPDVAVLRAELVTRGLAPGPITTPFFAPRGEFRLVDPDGYVLMVSHT